jgi:hypothetical protein
VVVGVDEDGIAVRLRFRRLARADIAAGADEILDKKLLAKMVGEFLRYQPPEHVDRAAWSERYDHTDRTTRKCIGA